MFLVLFFNDKVQDQGPSSTCDIVQYSSKILKKDALSNTPHNLLIFAPIRETR